MDIIYILFYIIDILLILEYHNKMLARFKIGGRGLK